MYFWARMMCKRALKVYWSKPIWVDAKWTYFSDQIKRLFKDKRLFFKDKKKTKNRDRGNDINNLASRGKEATGLCGAKGGFMPQRFFARRRHIGTTTTGAFFCYVFAFSTSFSPQSLSSISDTQIAKVLEN